MGGALLDSACGCCKNLYKICIMFFPASTELHSLHYTHLGFWAQWATVKMCLSVIRVPPHWCFQALVPSHSPVPKYPMEVIHGHDPQSRELLGTTRGVPKSFICPHLILVSPEIQNIRLWNVECVDDYIPYSFYRIYSSISGAHL